MRLIAIIGKDGSVRNLSVVEGGPPLLQLALEAVQQWHYEPYLVNGKPVEVETAVRVRFSFDEQ